MCVCVSVTRGYSQVPQGGTHRCLRGVLTGASGGYSQAGPDGLDFATSGRVRVGFYFWVRFRVGFGSGLAVFAANGKGDTTPVLAGPEPPN